MLTKFNKSILIKDDEKSSCSSDMSLYKSESLIDKSEMALNQFQLIEGSQYYTSDEEQKDKRPSTKIARMARRASLEIDEKVEVFQFYKDCKIENVAEIIDRLNVNSEKTNNKYCLKIDEAFKYKEGAYT